MREKSQIEDMRAALRGDIERARARREADPWRAQEPEPAAEELEPAASEGSSPEGSVPAGTAEEPVAVETIDEPVAVEGLTLEGSVPEEPLPEPAAVEPIEESAPEPAPQQEARSGFFARLFRRG